MKRIPETREAVQHWVERHDYKGYDPGDGLTSFLRPLTFGNLFAERVLLQIIWKSPLNLRPVLGVRPLDSTKGRGFMAWGYLLLYQAEQNPIYLEKAVSCLKWLEAHNDGEPIGYAWGNHFDFTTRGGRMKAHTPTVVWSGLIGQAYIEAYRQTADSHFLDVAEGIGKWIIALPRENTSTGHCLSYTPVSLNSVHNSNLLGAAMLSCIWKYRPDPNYLEIATEAIRYSCTRQLPDGSWWYGEEPKHHWIDSFHTGYNLDSIKRFIDSTGDSTYKGALLRGYDYFKNTFFEKSGCPRYYHTSTYPIDIQCAAQAIDTFCSFESEDPEALTMARRIADWTIENMQSPRGFFYYRLYPLIKAKTAYFHWGQATMFKALAHLESRAKKSCQSTFESPRWERIPEISGASALPSYALITPARNEEDFIERTIQAVLAQSVRPIKWVIVSDASTDRTDRIVQKYTEMHPWIELLRMPDHADRQFAAKAHAFNAGFDRLSSLQFDVIGNLDADISFEPDYFEFLLGRFAADPELGVTGTPFIEDANNPEHHTYAHKFTQLEHVSGACQLFRRSCFERIGGYKPVKGGAVDWIAVTTARMHGWRTRTFTEKVCLHHRKLGTGNNHPLMVGFHYGTKAYFVGSHPLWAFLRGIFRMRQKPLLIGGILFELGYFWALISRMPREVPSDLMSFHRSEEIMRLRQGIRRRRPETSAPGL